MIRKLKRKYKILKKWLIPELKGKICGIRHCDYKATPIVINNYNRVTSLKRLINSLESRGYYNIYIIDNNSTYPPLLDYYLQCKYPVFMLHKNIGHLAVWKTGLYKLFRNSYFAYTDSDVVLHPDCPDNFMEKFIALLKKYPKTLKAGFSICINDLPPCYKYQKKVQEWESQFWREEIEPNIFKAPIDTTFAVYKPFFKGELVDFDHCYIRIGFPYSIQHLPWYIDSENLSEEEKYYIEHLQTSTHWSEQNK